MTDTTIYVRYIRTINDNEGIEFVDKNSNNYISQFQFSELIPTSRLFKRNLAIRLINGAPFYLKILDPVLPDSHYSDTCIQDVLNGTTLTRTYKNGQQIGVLEK